MKELLRRRLKKIWDDEIKMRGGLEWPETRPHLRLDLYILLYTACHFWTIRRYSGIYVRRGAKTRWYCRDRAGLFPYYEVHYWSYISYTYAGLKLFFRSNDDIDPDGC